jgi:hypothetical protein
MVGIMLGIFLIVLVLGFIAPGVVSLFMIPGSAVMIILWLNAYRISRRPGKEAARLFVMRNHIPLLRMIPFAGSIVLFVGILVEYHYALLYSSSFRDWLLSTGVRLIWAGFLVILAGVFLVWFKRS